MVDVKEMPNIVSREEWLAARKKLLEKEKELTRAQDALSVERRELPMVKVDKDYAFEGEKGRLRLIDLFEGRRQLIVYHFMFGPSWDKGCPSCTSLWDESSEGRLAHLNARDTTMAAVARAPFAKIELYKKSRGWTFPFYSSYGSDFNYDFHVTIDEKVAPFEYGFRTAEEHRKAGTGYWLEGERPLELPGFSCFLRDANAVFLTYQTYGRGGEAAITSYKLLDLTALGRQEVWEEPKGRVEHPFPPIPHFQTERIQDA